jgi:hypothetical protein
MPIRPTPRPPRIDPRVGPIAPGVIVLPDVIIDLPRADWFRPLPPGVILTPGTVAPGMIRVPERDAQAVLRATIHLAADIRAEQPPNVVWTLGADELQVMLDQTRIVCARGLITIALTAQCDEVKGAQRLDVGFAVGRPDRPTGLIMSTFDRVQGNATIAAAWSEALTAFAWEALVGMATQLAAGMGKDSRGRALVPGSIAADANTLFITPMARHDLRFVSAP